jgi:hypothetical protein
MRVQESMQSRAQRGRVPRSGWRGYRKKNDPVRYPLNNPVILLHSPQRRHLSGKYIIAQAPLLGQRGGTKRRGGSRVRNLSLACSYHPSRDALRDPAALLSQEGSATLSIGPGVYVVLISAKRFFSSDVVRGCPYSPGGLGQLRVLQRERLQ